MSVDWTEQLESEIRTYIKNLERFETRLEEVNNDYNGCLQNLKERRASLARQFGVPEEIDVQFLRINPSLDEPVRQYIEACCLLYRKFGRYFQLYFVGEEGDGRVKELNEKLIRVNLSPDSDNNEAHKYSTDHYLNLFGLLWACGYREMQKLSEFVDFSDVLRFACQKSYDFFYLIRNRTFASEYQIVVWPNMTANFPFKEAKNTKMASELFSFELEDDNEDPMFSQAVQIVTEAGMASAFLLQKNMRIGYSRASRLVDLLEEKGVIGPSNGGQSRTVLIQRSEENTVTATEELENEKLTFYKTVSQSIISAKVLSRNFLDSVLRFIAENPHADLPDVVANLRRNAIDNDEELKQEFELFASAFH